MGNTRAYHSEDAFSMKWLHSAALSPDASRVAYALSEYDAESDKDIVNLWVIGVESSEPRQVTSRDGSDASPAWAPDGQSLAFVSDRVDGVPQVFLDDGKSGEPMQLTALPNGVDGAPVWSPDGTRLAFTAGQQHSPPQDPSKPYRVTRNVYRFDGLGYVHRALNDVYIVAVGRHGAHGEVAADQAERLTDNDAVNGGLVWSPDGSKLLFTRGLDRDTFLSVRPNVASVDLAGNETTIISNTDYAVSTATWHPDSTRVIFAGTPRSRPNGSKADLYVTHGGSGSDGEPINRTAALSTGVCGLLLGDMPSRMDLSPLKISVSADGASAWCDVQRGGTTAIARIALDGPESVDPVLDGERCLRLLDIHADTGKVFFAAANINSPIDLFLGDLDGGSEKQVTSVNRDLLAGLDTATVRRMTFASVDGAEVEAFHVAPDDRVAAWPTILNIHGGPHMAFGHHYRFDTHALLAAGFAVLMVNQRASSGYGDAFGTAIISDWGNLDYHDLMYGIDHAIAEGLADPDRLGVCGLSGGGYLSCWSVGQTDRFKAAVPENPITNWVSSYGAGDASAWLAVEELGGHPHEIPEIYARCSPITHAHNCTTPTLLIQGEHDWRCTAEQSEQFYTVLKINGCDVEMLRLPASSHLGSIAGRPEVRRAKNEAMLDWLTRHVLAPPAE